VKVTEREANDKTCHLTIGNGNGGHGCIGPQCMAWRWSLIDEKRFIPVFNTGVLYGAPEVPKTTDLLSKYVESEHCTWGKKIISTEDGPTYWYGWFESDRSFYMNRKGYCGLAGKIGEVDEL